MRYMGVCGVPLKMKENKSNKIDIKYAVFHIHFFQAETGNEI